MVKDSIGGITIRKMAIHVVKLSMESKKSECDDKY